jgi:integrase
LVVPPRKYFIFSSITIIIVNLFSTISARVDMRPRSQLTPAETGTGDPEGLEAKGWPSPKQPYRWDIGKEFRQLVRSLGIEDVRIHDLRHTGPSVLLMQGIPGDVVRKITGHRSRELERYQHLSPSSGPRRRPDCPGAFQ